jgi:hypothetical protein
VRISRTSIPTRREPVDAHRNERQLGAQVAFTTAEIAYINAQPLARVATVAADGQPDVTAVCSISTAPFLYRRVQPDRHSRITQRQSQDRHDLMTS